MWNLLGDAHPPPGTYFWKKVRAEGYLWHMLDQCARSGRTRRTSSRA
jgi:hypothetical protein